MPWIEEWQVLSLKKIKIEKKRVYGTEDFDGIFCPINFLKK